MPRGYDMKIDTCYSRLAGQFLTTSRPARAVEVVRALGAVQAQDYAGAKWGVGQRTENATDAQIDSEIDTGQILRTHILRPTWHFVAASDIRWMLALSGPRLTALLGPPQRRLDLDRRVFRRTHAVIEKAMAGGRSLTRSEIRTHLERARIPTGTSLRLSHIVMQAELDGIVCSGPRRGKQFTYALLDERSPSGSALTRDEALRELGRRYFATRGPATAHDFAWWSGLTVTDAKRSIELNATEVQRVTLGDRYYWMSREADRPPRATATAHLLPNYDEYFIGFRDRSAIAARLGDASPLMAVSGLVPHIIVVDGQLVGKWTRAAGKDGVVVSLQSFTRLGKRESARVVDQARRFGRFLGLPVRACFT